MFFSATLLLFTLTAFQMLNAAEICRAKVQNQDSFSRASSNMPLPRRPAGFLCGQRHIWLFQPRVNTTARWSHGSTAASS